MQLETLTKALADQTRLRIMMLILTEGELCVCDLTNTLEMVQPKISRHLAILRDSQLLQTRKTGLWVFYSLHEQLPRWALDMLENLLSGSQQRTRYISISTANPTKLLHSKRLNNIKSLLLRHHDPRYNNVVPAA